MTDIIDIQEISVNIFDFPDSGGPQAALSGLFDASLAQRAASSRQLLTLLLGRWKCRCVFSRMGDLWS